MYLLRYALRARFPRISRINGCLGALKKLVTIFEIRDLCSIAQSSNISSARSYSRLIIRLHFQITAAHFPSNFRELVS